MTLPGKYTLLLKSSNCLSNSFNVICLWGVLVGLMFLMVFLKKKWAEKWGTEGRYNIVSRIFNILYLGLILNVFYFSLIELNLNIATQFASFPLKSAFSYVGAIVAVIMLLLEGTGLFFMLRYF